ncbi:MAG: hypothetical protein JXR40_00480 [Pontiellaceae bacterium]|nr:hypothetical protein [Pontiellaceae bacterium]
MGRENIGHWSVRKCSKTCAKCEKEFADKEALFSRLLADGEEYVREDFCRDCWNKKHPGLSVWKTVFLVPPPPAEEAVKKENAESLLRKLIDQEDEADLDAVFILAVMLERKRILVERDVQTAENGTKMRIYEHRKTGESFLIVDPQLKLDELEEVQERVVLLLGGKPRGVESAADSSDQEVGVEGAVKNGGENV